MVALLVSTLSVVSSAEAGYWKMQGDPQLDFGPNNQSREWVAQGATIQIRDYSARHVTVTESGMVGGGFNTITWRSEWSPPDQIMPSEVINVSVKATLTSLSYERPQWPWDIEVPMCQFTGLGGPIMVINGEDINATAPGQSRVTTNTSVKASAGNNAAAILKFSIPIRYGYHFQVIIPYVWVEGTTSAPIGGPNTGQSSSSSGGSEQQIFSSANDYAVSGLGMPVPFTLNQATKITYIMTYHWNDGRGAPGGGSVKVLRDNGETYGPWPVSVTNGVYWIASPNVVLPPGRYELRDSEPQTWSKNKESNWQGHMVIKGIPQ